MQAAAKLAWLVEHNDLAEVTASLNDMTYAGSVDSSTAVAVMDHAEAILCKCRFAIAVNNNTFVSAAMGLLSLAFSALPEVDVAHHMQANGKRLWENFAAIAEELAVKDKFGPTVTIDVLTVLNTVCQVPPLKDIVGHRFVEPLCGMLNVTSATGAPTGSARLAATCLINLVNGSKTNKERIQPLLSSPAAVLASTDDYFLQLQCAEMIFRVVRLKFNLLDRVTSLPPLVRAALPGVPNDASMLDRIMTILDRFNSDQNPVRILTVPIVAVAVRSAQGGTTKLCEGTTVHFSATNILVMVPSAVVGSHVHIEYCNLRSAKVTSELKFEAKLRQPPRQLVHVMAADEHIVLSLSPAVADTLKSSPLHQWLLAAFERQRAQRGAAAGQQPSPAISGRAQPAPFGAFATAPDVSPVQRVAMPPRLDNIAPIAPVTTTSHAAAPAVPVVANTPSMRASEAPRRPRAALDAMVADAHVESHQQQQEGVTMHGGAVAAVPPAARRRHMSERDANAAAAPGIGAKSASVVQSNANGEAHQPPLHFASSLPRLDLGVSDLGAAFFASEPTRGPASGVGMYRAPSLQTAAAVGDMTGALEHVKRSIGDAIEVLRADGTTIIASARAETAALLQRFCDDERRSRDALETCLAQDLQHLREEEASLRVFITEAFDDITATLQNVRAIGDVIDQRIAALRAAVDASVSASEETELAMLQSFKSRIDGDIGELEATLLQAAASVNTQRFLQQIMQQLPQQQQQQ